ncbi:MAG: class I SAM-dependent methyltransferase, partial [Myxococcales bacterium]|nr:class I SAM-dependent methyltransferase [Myxococcales bacterium]
TTAHYLDAAYYDQAYRRRRQDVRFYAETVATLGGPVLELGVGTARVALAMAQTGAEIVGVDSMESMLARARERIARAPKMVRERIALRQGDLRSLRLRKKFPLVVSPFNVLMHLYSRQDWEKALATVKAHLAPKGHFVFDILLPDPFMLSRDPDRKFSGGKVRHPSDGKLYKYTEQYEYDPKTQIQTVTMEFHRRGRVIQTPLTHREIFPAELEALLHYNGFRIEDHYGDFERGPLDRYSESQVVIARRR